MTPSGPNNQSFLLRIAPTSPRRQVVVNSEECWLYYAIKKGESKTRPLSLHFNKIKSILRSSLSPQVVN